MPAGLIERYREHLPLEEGDPVVTLNEGSTPLVEAPVISERVGARVFLKLEGANPTGSFKDRGMTVAVSRAAGRGAEAVICASTGNTAASAAAYAARAGMRGAVIVPEGKIAIGKLAQALMHGARVIAIRGNFDDALTLVRELAQKHPIELVNSVNPYRIEGQKTAAYEVIEELGEAPGALAIPVGNAGNITAWWRGFGEREEAPKLYGFQAEGAAPLVSGKPVANPETVASAIRIGNPARWEEAMTAVTQSRGRIAAVTDEQILDAYRLLASREGVFCEPASAASVAGILTHGLPVVEGDTPPESVVCVLTGHGLKDPDTALGKAPAVVGLRERPRRGRARRFRLNSRAFRRTPRLTRDRRSADDSPGAPPAASLIAPPLCGICAAPCEPPTTLPPVRAQAHATRPAALRAPRRPRGDQRRSLRGRRPRARSAAQVLLAPEARRGRGRADGAAWGAARDGLARSGPARAGSRARSRLRRRGDPRPARRARVPGRARRRMP